MRVAQRKFPARDGFRPGAGRPGPTARDGNKGSARGSCPERMRPRPAAYSDVARETEAVSNGSELVLNRSPFDPQSGTFALEKAARRQAPGGSMLPERRRKTQAALASEDDGSAPDSCSVSVSNSPAIRSHASAGGEAAPST